MDKIKKQLDNKLDNIYIKIINPYELHRIKLIELQKEVNSVNDILKLQTIIKQIDKIHNDIKSI